MLTLLGGCSLSLDEVDVTVFNATEEPYSLAAVGFANVPQFDNIRLPRSEYLDTLQPQVFRNKVEYADNIDFRVLQLGAIHQVDLSSAYDTSKDVYPGDSGSWSLWDQYLEEHVSKERIYHFEIWDKPDVSWSRDMDQFMDMWERSYNYLKKNSDRAIVLGPGLSTYNSEEMFAFLGEAQRRNVLPDIVTWHESTSIQEHTQEVRSYLQSQELSKLIGINAYGSESDTPSDVLDDIIAIEQQEIYAAVRHCKDDCQMGGLLLDGKQTPLWWVYKAYADLQGRRITASQDVLGTTDGAGFYLLVSSEESEIVYHFQDFEDEPLASLYLIPSDTEILEQPTSQDYSSSFEDNVYKIGWKNVDPDGVYLLRVLRQSTR